MYLAAHHPARMPFLDSRPLLGDMQKLFQQVTQGPDRQNSFGEFDQTSTVKTATSAISLAIKDLINNSLENSSEPNNK